MADEKSKHQVIYEHGLENPVMAYGEERTKLSFRKPTGMDIWTFGDPVIVDQMTRNITFHPQKMTDMLSALATVPDSTITALDTRDWNGIAWELAHYFMPNFGTDYEQPLKLVDGTELTFRKPTGMDMLKIGNPVNIDMRAGNFTFNEQRMFQMMSALSGAKIEVIAGIDTQDWAGVAYHLAGFFMPRAGTGTSTSAN